MTHPSDEMAAVEVQFTEQLQERDVAVAERLAATEEAAELENEAAAVREELAACNQRLLAIRNSEHELLMQEQRAETRLHSGGALVRLGQLAEALELSNRRMEDRIYELCAEGSELRCRSSVVDGEAQVRTLQLANEERQELEVFGTRVARYEEQISYYERANCELHDEYRTQGEALCAEIQNAKETSWRESLELVRCEDEAASQHCEVASQRNQLSARLETLRQAAADANSTRGRLRRLVREAENRSASSGSDFYGGQQIVDDVEGEQNSADRRIRIAESELFELNMQRRRDEQNWSSRAETLRERKRTLNNILAEYAARSQEAMQREEALELRAARMQLSQVEIRSQEAQQGLSAALTQLSLRQVGHGSLSYLSASHASMGRGRPLGNDAFTELSPAAGLKPAPPTANGRSSAESSLLSLGACRNAHSHSPPSSLYACGRAAIAPH